MREPLLDVAIPKDKASLGDHYRAGGGDEKILLMLQVYDSVRSQENIRDVLSVLAGDAGVRLVAVENADGPLASDSSMTAVADIIRVKEVSAGVISLLNSRSTAIEVQGVDDMGAIRESYGAMSKVQAGLPARDDAFGSLRPWLRKAQEKLYPPPLARAFSGALSVHASSLPIGQQAAALNEAATGLGMELKGFPALRRFLQTAAAEKTIDERRPAQQMKIFMTRLTDRLSNWHKKVGRNQVQLDLEKVQPILEYWLETTGQSAEEFEQKLRLGGAEPVLLALKRWIDDWLVEQALAQAGGPGPFIEELMRLALRLDVPYFDLLDLRRSVAMQRDFPRLKETLSDEITECGRWLAESLGPDASACYHALREIDLMFRALGLAVPSAEAESAEIGGDRLMALIDDLSRRVGQAPPAGVLDKMRALAPGLDGAADFLRLSRQRSRHMVERMLDLMRDQSADRLVLVIGGFHQRAITRALEDHRYVSWSVIIPSLDSTKLGHHGSFWGQS